MNEFIKAHNDFLDEITAGLKFQPERKVAGVLFDDEVKEHFESIGMNCYVFLPKIAGKYPWDVGSIWKVEKINGKDYIVEKKEEEVPTNQKEESKVAQLSGDVWEVPSSVLLDVHRNLEDENLKRELTSDEQANLFKVEEELKKRKLL